MSNISHNTRMEFCTSGKKGQRCGPNWCHLSKIWWFRFWFRSRVRSTKTVKNCWIDIWKQNRSYNEVVVSATDSTLMDFRNFWHLTHIFAESFDLRGEDWIPSFNVPVCLARHIHMTEPRPRRTLKRVHMHIPEDGFQRRWVINSV